MKPKKPTKKQIIKVLESAEKLLDTLDVNSFLSKAYRNIEDAIYNIKISGVKG